MNRILTERLMLRTLTLADLDDCFMDSTKPSAGWMPHGTQEETRHLLESVYIGKESIWGIVRQDTGKLVGSIGLMHDFKREYERARSVGYALNEDCRGKGYMTEAVQAVLRHAFERRGLSIISAYAYPWNVSSRRVLEKCGFRYEGTLKRAATLSDGSLHDNDCYAITREEWVDWIFQDR